MSILSDIPFIGKLIDDYGEKLVLQGVQKLTGIDLSKEELMVLGSLIIVSRFIP